MSYIRKNLNPNENVVHLSKLHWIVFIKPLFLWIIGVAMATSSTEDTAILGWMIVVLIAIPYSISIAITHKTSEFGVTDRRVIAKVGFVRRTSLETLLQKVEGIDVNQGIIGRLLNYGSITVRGTGGSNKSIKRIRAPLLLRRAVYDQIENLSVKDKIA